MTRARYSTTPIWDAMVKEYGDPKITPAPLRRSRKRSNPDARPVEDGPRL